MTYRLIIGDYAHSSWSLRAWLIFEVFGLPREVQLVDFATGPVADQLTRLAPARTVPAVVTPEGTLLWESLAIAEELAARHPEVGLWPEDRAERATARSLAAEMHAGFQDLRNECPMALRVAYSGFEVSEAVRADLGRLELLWAHARKVRRTEGPWLLGRYSVADAFYAPVATRIATYDLPVSAEAQAYVDLHLANPAFRRFRALGLTHGTHLPRYDKDLPRRPWPGPAPLPAAPAEGPSENAVCPFSGQPATHFWAAEGRIIGFCNPVCRDKSMADPLAWPEVAALLGR